MSIFAAIRAWFAKPPPLPPAPPPKEAVVTIKPNDQKQNLRAAMDAAGITNQELRAGIMAIAGGESGFVPRTELGYGHTSNARIRAIFGSRVPSKDSDLDLLKSSDREFFNRVYGGEWGKRNLGNIEVNDGYRFRGRGDFQLTGRANFERMGKRIGVDLVSNPDLANDPEVSAKIAVAYITDRYKGGGWEAMKRAVGHAVGSSETVKDRLYAEYLASGEFA